VVSLSCCLRHFRRRHYGQQNCRDSHRSAPPTTTKTKKMKNIQILTEILQKLQLHHRNEENKELSK